MAMGTRMGPSYACLFVGYVEQSPFRSYTGPKPHLFLCYIDDYIGGASCSHVILLSVQFVLRYCNFKDPIDSHSYLDYNTFHPPSCKNVIPYSQFLRLRHISSQDGAFHSRTSQMSSYFKDRN
eukprot:g16645.t1